jgi:hypothetical protein
MNRTDLNSKSKTELLKLAKRLGLRGISTLKKDALIAKILAARLLKKMNSVRRASSSPSKDNGDVRRRAIRKRAKTRKTVVAPPSIARKRKTTKNSGAARKIAAASQPTPDDREMPSQKSSAKNKPVTAAAASEMSAHKFDVSPQPPKTRRNVSEESLGELPECYGTGKLFVFARDPDWLYVYWDLNRRQLAEARSRAVDGRVVLRLFEKNHQTPAQEITLHHNSRDWYISGTRAATTYVGQLGYWENGGHFHEISHSRETTTPSAVVSTDTSARFATIPFDVPLAELSTTVRPHRRDWERLAEALYRLQVEGMPFPFEVGDEVFAGDDAWSETQTTVVEKAMGGNVSRATRGGSSEAGRESKDWDLSSRAGASPGGAGWSADRPTSS